MVALEEVVYCKIQGKTRVGPMVTSKLLGFPCSHSQRKLPLKTYWTDTLQLGGGGGGTMGS